MKINFDKLRVLTAKWAMLNSNQRMGYIQGFNDCINQIKKQLEEEDATK